MAASASLVTQLSGTGINAYKSTDTWQPESQLEQVYKIKDTDGSITIPFTEVENIHLMIFKCDSGAYFNLSFTISAHTVTYSTNNFVFNPNPTMITNITAITISTASTTEILIDTRIYGESST